ncbi:hypothetical protein MHYP_G00244280 [Metynnis hypsauchen]
MGAAHGLTRFCIHITGFSNPFWLEHSTLRQRLLNPVLEDPRLYKKENSAAVSVILGLLRSPYARAAAAAYKWSDPEGRVNDVGIWRKLGAY